MKPSPTLLRACGKGSATACDIARKICAIYAGGVVQFSEAAIDAKHPNKLPFSGVLLLTDEASDKPPHGSSGHRIFVPSSVVDEKLDGLVGMAVNYDPSDMNEHVTKNKVGVITKAGRNGNKVWVKGFVWKKDFPQAEKDLKRKDLGMSMELADVWVDNENASVWKLNDFEFTGATILKKNAAAYTNTSLAAKAAAVKGEAMPKDKEKKKIAAAQRDTSQNRSDGSMALLGQTITTSISSALKDFSREVSKEIKAGQDKLQETLEEMKGLQMIHAAADSDDDEIVLDAAGDPSDEGDDIDAAGDPSASMSAASDASASYAAAEDDDSSDDGSDATDDDASMDAMEDLELEDASEEPGEVNKDASNKGSKTSVTKPPKQGEHFKGNVAKGRLHSAGKNKKMSKPFPKVHSSASIQAAAVEAIRSNKKLRRTISDMQASYDQSTKKMRIQIKTLNAQLERFADLESRRSAIPVELTNLASKSGINLSELKANGQVLSVEAVDTMFANAAARGTIIDPKDRIALKHQLLENGFMDQGVVDRGYGRAN